MKIGNYIVIISEDNGNILIHLLYLVYTVYYIKYMISHICVFLFFQLRLIVNKYLPYRYPTLTLPNSSGSHRNQGKIFRVSWELVKIERNSGCYHFRNISISKFCFSVKKFVIKLAHSIWMLHTLFKFIRYWEPLRDCDWPTKYPWLRVNFW